MGIFYHHCAELQITADPAKPIDSGLPAAELSGPRVNLV
jgi:hypothetical protein